MPCRCDHMEPTKRERYLSAVMSFIDELNGTDWEKDWLEGNHPLIYNKGVSQEDADHWVSTLCSRLQETDVSKCSLELQMWWRDHQAADEKRIKKELAQNKIQKARDTVLKKLSAYERKLLGH